MKNKSVLIIKLINSVFIAMFMIYLFLKITNLKIALIPFLICSFAILGKNIIILIEKPKYISFFDKLFYLSLASYIFGFLTYWCYINIINKNYLSLFLSIPFWIIGIFRVRQKFSKSKNIFPFIK